MFASVSGCADAEGEVANRSFLFCEAVSVPNAGGCWRRPNATNATANGSNDSNGSAPLGPWERVACPNVSTAAVGANVSINRTWDPATVPPCEYSKDGTVMTYSGHAMCVTTQVLFSLKQSRLQQFGAATRIQTVFRVVQCLQYLYCRPSSSSVETGL